MKRTTAVPVVFGFCLSECMRRKVPVCQCRATIEDMIGPAETELQVDRFGRVHRFKVRDLP